MIQCSVKMDCLGIVVGIILAAFLIVLLRIYMKDIDWRMLAEPPPPPPPLISGKHFTQLHNQGFALYTQILIQSVSDCNYPEQFLSGTFPTNQLCWDSA